MGPVAVKLDLLKVQFNGDWPLNQPFPSDRFPAELDLLNTH
jgi:hypothetical protein